MTATCDGSLGCLGEPVTGYPQCLGHLAEGDFAAVLGQVYAGECGLRAVRAPLSRDRVERIVSSAPRPKGRAVLTDASFEGATFADVAGFANVDFNDEVSFADATFCGNADFVDATFRGPASFDEATFEEGLWLSGAKFASGVSFAECRFRREITVRRFVVIGDLDIHRATFAESARIDVAADTD